MEQKSASPEVSDNGSTEALLADLDAGVLLQKLGRALRDAALGTVAHGGKGKVVLEFAMSRVGESTQVECKHTIRSTTPTRRGRIVEDNVTSTPLYVAGNGRVSLFPIQSQTTMFGPKD